MIPIFERVRSIRRRYQFHGTRLLVTATLIGLIVAVIVSVGIITIGGPIEFGVVRSMAESAIRSRLGEEIDVKVGTGAVGWTYSEGMTVRLRDVDVDGREAGYQFKIDHLSLVTDAWDVMIGSAAPRKVDVDGLDIKMRMPVAGGLSVPVVATKSPVVRAQLESAHRHVLSLAKVVGDTQMQAFSLTNSNISIFSADDTENPSWRISDLIATLVGMDGGVLRLDLSGAGRSGRWTAQITHGPGEATREDYKLTAIAKEFTWSDFVPPKKQLDLPNLPEMPVYTKFAAAFENSGALVSARSEMVLGAGFIIIGDEDATILDEAVINLLWSDEKQRIIILPSRVDLGETFFNLTGLVTPPRELDGPWDIFLGLRESRVRPRDVEGPPVTLDWIGVKGRLIPKKKQFFIQQAELTVGPAYLTVGGTIDITKSGPIVALAGNFGPMPVQTLKRIWPSLISPNTRRWIVKNVEDGTILRGTVDLALGPENFDGDPHTYGWPDDAVNMQFDFQNVATHTFGGLPMLKEATGRGHITKGRFMIEVDSGKMVTERGKSIELENGSFSIPDVRPPDMDGVVDLTLKGPVPIMGEIISSDPIRALRESGLRPGHLSGDMKAYVHAQFALEKELPFDSVDWVVEADMQNFSSSSPIDGRLISKGKLKLSANPRQVRIRGRAFMDGHLTNLDMVEPLSGTGTGSREVRLILDDRGRRKAGLDFGGILTGPVAIDISQADNTAGEVYHVDLTRARLVVPVFGWTKGAGVPGKAKFTVVDAKNGKLIKDLSITAEGLNARGSARLNARGRLMSVTMKQFGFRKSDRSSVVLKFGKKGRLDVTFKAKTFDGRSLIRNLKSSGPDVGKDDFQVPVKVTASVERLTGYGGAALRNAKLTTRIIKSRVRDLDMSASTPTGKPVTITIKKAGKNRNLTANTSDTGSVLRFLDVYDRMVGGRGFLTAEMSSKGRSRGRAVVKKFQVSEDPTLSELITNSASEIDSKNQRVRIGNKLKQSRSHYDALDVLFVYGGKMLTINKTRLRSPTIGITAHGKVNMRRKTVSLAGTFIPAYGINNIFGKIPILGIVLGAGSDGGLLGVTFRLAGALDKPVLTLNPVSAIAPGIFRKIFEYQ